METCMEPEPTYRRVGGALSPAKAGFLEMELAARGIETRIRFCGTGEDDLPNRQVVEVPEKDHAAALETRAATLDAGGPGAGEAQPKRKAKSGGKRTTTLVAAAVGLVAVARLGRLFHVGLKGFLGISAAVALLVAFYFMPSGDAPDRPAETRRKAKP